MKNRIPPRILTDAGLSMFVNTVKLRELPLPIVEINMKELTWHLDMPVWEKDETNDWNLTPREVIKKECGSAGHQKKIEVADVSFPILVARYNARYVILDGIHRLVRLFLQGQKKVKTKIVPTEYLSLKEYQSE